MPRSTAGFRLWREGTLVKGVARCDTSYGPVVLQAQADARAVGEVFKKIRAGMGAPQATASALRDTEKAVRQNLLEQAGQVPTESSNEIVEISGHIIGAARRGHPGAIGCLKQLAAQEQTGDTKAGAHMALVKSLARNGGPSTACGGFPAYHRASVSVSGVAVTLTPAQHTKVKAVLTTAVSKIPAKVIHLKLVSHA